MNQGFFSQSDKPDGSHLKQAVPGNSKSNDRFHRINPDLFHVFSDCIELEGLS